MKGGREWSPVRAAWLLATLLLPVAAAAVGFDPLVLSWTAHLAADGTLREDAPAGAALYFPPSDPATPPLPLAFSAPSPVAFRPSAPAQLHLVLAAEKPLVARNADGASLDVALLADGQPLATARYAHALPLLAPGDRIDATLDLDAGDAFVAEGAALSLRVTALMPAVPEQGLKLVEGALAFPQMRVPDVRALRLQDAALDEFLATEARAGAEVRVDHAGVTASALDAPLVVLRGEEDAATAAAHQHANRTKRIAAAHEFLVGSTLVRVHPGVGVAVPVGDGAQVKCVKNCPPGGFEAVVRLGGNATTTPPPTATTPDDGVLVPPPRATPPTKEDEKATPLGMLALAALLVAATARRR